MSRIILLGLLFRGKAYREDFGYIRPSNPAQNFFTRHCTSKSEKLPGLAAALAAASQLDANCGTELPVYPPASVKFTLIVVSTSTGSPFR
jgi:hypothetical protein